MIIGSSNHPVEVKKICIEVWSFKDELKHIIKEEFERINGTDKKINLSEIKNRYSRPKEEAPAIDSSGNPMDDAANEMAAALGELNETGETKIDEKNSESKEANERPAAIIRKRPNLNNGEIGAGVLFLADINMDEILFFSQKEFIAGQSIALNLLVPSPFIVSAEVITCIEHNSRSRIISNARCPFRIRVRPTFATHGERTFLRNFLKSIEPDLPKVAEKAEAKGTEQDQIEKIDL